MSRAKNLNLDLELNYMQDLRTQVLANDPWTRLELTYESNLVLVPILVLEKLKITLESDSHLEIANGAPP